MRTSVGLLAFASFIAAFPLTASAQEVTWRKSYFEARDHGQKAKKPLAVVVGNGPTGYEQIVQDGSLNGEIRKIIAAEYIPVYLDANQAENQRLIRELGITNGRGIVLSDRAGDSQAFFHEGSLSEKELARQLSYFASPSIVVRTTATSNGQTSYYPPSPNGGLSYPSYGGFPTYGGPAYGGPMYGGFAAPAGRSTVNC